MTAKQAAYLATIINEYRNCRTVEDGFSPSEMHRLYGWIAEQLAIRLGGLDANGASEMINALTYRDAGGVHTNCYGGIGGALRYLAVTDEALLERIATGNHK